MPVTRAARSARKSFPSPPRTLAGQVFLLQLLVVVLLAGMIAAAFVFEAHRWAVREAYDRSLAVSETFAHAPGTRAAMESRDPSAILQPSAEATRRTANVTYVVAFDPNGIRWSHPDASLIGGHVSGGFAPAFSGEPFQETFDSTLFGQAVDTTVAVFGERGEVVGLVSVGITVQSVNEVVLGQLPLLLGLVAIALALAAGGSALISRRLRAQTHGLGPVEMTRMYEHHDAVLHAVREGVVIVSSDGRLVLANDEARRLLDLSADGIMDRSVSGLGVSRQIADLLASGRTANDDVHLVGGRLVSVNQRAVGGAGQRSGSVATLRDTTELRTLATRADVAHDRLQLLYDAGLTIGTTLDVTRTAEELAAVAVPRFADFVTVELFGPVFQGDEPTAAVTEMRRAVASGIRDDHPFLPAGRIISLVPGNPLAAGTVTGRPHIEADLDGTEAWRTVDPDRARRILEFGIHSLVSVPLRARGVVLGTADFWRSDQRSFDADDLSFAEELGARAAVAVDNARRYTREHSAAVTLQRSLLPRALPEQPALETAYRYLPAKAGVGGDWFDVIGLSGARFALVVGDVVGHGVHAAATMGRLRTAVLNFSALDLPPDELLAHLDELVTRIDAGWGADDEDAAVTGATCLYAVYDQVTGACTVARAGHPGPAVVAPDGRTTFPDIPGSPPLGLGGNMPFETAELQLAPGSLLVMFTDGLVQGRERDIGAGLALLRDVLAVPGRSPEDACQAVLEQVLGSLPSDDVTLLITRTSLMDQGRVAEWDVPQDTAAVSRIRTEVQQTLERWDLDELAHTTALIISELVTNAIRYGAPPLRLRLLHDQASLICEVADDSSTAPHLRRAEISDEGGRGLFLVAQFADRWGTRYLPHGKIIWTEQLLDRPDLDAGTPDEETLLAQWADDE
ncbi:SpoIIE family protein phosphatase/ATP-binding protein [Streptomyces poriferorum]|uniref:SpoIIE family protein phosphatase n=1 Tax=Streptomyces poriferorum TaxID=2798799 RepID=A0ABY9IIY2_9ACTN|nr:MULTISPECIES: SpoIIE family protein phosphatase/ATP-binding protein [unclassified Streptomyces]MDP5316941.1 SpoIIE family protein phosphatase [Streptomyces sp. Alt4]WLQ55222.1 SpoIIE family protein phosphatase [Streptomyces sp. Alt2]